MERRYTVQPGQLIQLLQSGQLTKIKRETSTTLPNPYFASPQSNRNLLDMPHMQSCAKIRLKEFTPEPSKGNGFLTNAPTTELALKYQSRNIGFFNNTNDDDSDVPRDIFEKLKKYKKLSKDVELVRKKIKEWNNTCLLYTSPSPRDS